MGLSCSTLEDEIEIIYNYLRVHKKKEGYIRIYNAIGQIIYDRFLGAGNHDVYLNNGFYIVNNCNYLIKSR